MDKDHMTGQLVHSHESIIIGRTTRWLEWPPTTTKKYHRHQKLPCETTTNQTTNYNASRKLTIVGFALPVCYPQARNAFHDQCKIQGIISTKNNSFGSSSNQNVDAETIQSQLLNFADLRTKKRARDPSPSPVLFLLHF